MSERLDLDAIEERIRVGGNGRKQETLALIERLRAVEEAARAVVEHVEAEEARFVADCVDDYGGIQCGHPDYEALRALLSPSPVRNTPR